MALADLIPAALEDEKTVKLAEVAEWFGVSTKTIHAWANRGRLPKPQQAGERTFLFKVKELREALKDKPETKKAKKRRA